MAAHDDDGERERGEGEGQRERERTSRIVSILYQYEIQTDGMGVKGTERTGAVRFCAPFGHQGNRTRALAVLQANEVDAEKREKSPLSHPRGRTPNDEEIGVLYTISGSYLLHRD